MRQVSILDSSQRSKSGLADAYLSHLDDLHFGSMRHHRPHSLSSPESAHVLILTCRHNLLSSPVPILLSALRSSHGQTTSHPLLTPLLRKAFALHDSAPLPLYSPSVPGDPALAQQAMVSSAFVPSTSIWSIRSCPQNSSTRSPHRPPARSVPCMKLEPGTHVRVSRSVIMFHYPGQKNEPTDINGFEGVIIKDMSETDGIKMSATMPYVVNFAPEHRRFKAHLTEDELEVLDK